MAKKFTFRDVNINANCSAGTDLNFLALVAGSHVILELLNLKSHLIEVVLSPDLHCCRLENLLSIETLVNGEMRRKSCLVRCQTPNPEAVDLPDSLDGEEGALDDVVVDVGGGRLQQDAQGLAQDADGRGQHKEAEHEGADWVDDVPFWLEVDHDGGDEDAKGLKEVAHDVDEGCSHVDILLVGNFVGVSIFSTMRMAVLCIVSMTMTTSTTASSK